MSRSAWSGLSQPIAAALGRLHENVAANWREREPDAPKQAALWLNPERSKPKDAEGC
jgi:hypothetical protein